MILAFEGGAEQRQRAGHDLAIGVDQLPETGFGTPSRGAFERIAVRQPLGGSARPGRGA